MPFYFQDWWLDVVCGVEGWGIVISKNNAGKIQGILPYSLKRRLGYTISRMPLLTPYLGIKLFYPKDIDKRSSLYSYESKVACELLSKINHLKFYNQYFEPKFYNVMPLYKEGYTPIAMSNYILDLDQSLDQIFAGLDSRVRNDIRKGQENFQIEERDELEVLYDLLNYSFSKTSGVPFTINFLKELDSKIIKHRERRISVVKDNNGDVACGVYLLKDNDTLYSLLIGSNPGIRKGGAVQAMIWHCIKNEHEQYSQLDFCGSILENIEPIFRGFGATQIPYFRVEKTSSTALKILKNLRAR